jgi:DNA-binding Lrp family transcriptional regulator
VRVVVLAAAKPGLESLVTEAWRVPNYWRVLERCEGAFTNYSVQLIPIKFMKEFREYISTMHAMNLIKSYRLIQTGDPEMMFPDFSNYNFSSGEWTFDWEVWLNELTTQGPTATIRDKRSRDVDVQKMSLTMLAYLELDARMKFTEIAERLGTSPQTVKYHYDRFVSKGIADGLEFFLCPYPVELSVFHEFMLEFADSASMDRFFSLAKKLFFVIQVSKALRRNTLMVSTRIVSSQVENLFTFFSEMTNLGLLNTYSGVRINSISRQVQTISFELYDDVSGWQWDRYENLLKLNKL